MRILPKGKYYYTRVAHISCIIELIYFDYKVVQNLLNYIIFGWSYCKDCYNIILTHLFIVSRYFSVDGNLISELRVKYTYSMIV